MDAGEIWLTASCEQQSGAGRSLTADHDGAIHRIDYSIDGQTIPAFAIDGSPAQAVLYALKDLVPRRPALCVSGINFGDNLGSGVTSSGTVGAALEAADEGVPALAISLETDKAFHYKHTEEIDLGVAQHFARFFVKRMLALAMPHDVDVLKVDVPCTAAANTPWRITRLSRQRCYRVLPSGRKHLAEKRRLGYTRSVDIATLEPDSDVHALLVDRVVSVTPLSLDLTSRVPFDELENALG
jgi:5'-nucleotidase